MAKINTMCLGYYAHVAFQDAVLKFANVANFYLLLISLILFRSKEKYIARDKK